MKLWRVTATKEVEFVCLAESEQDAEDFAEEAFKNEPDAALTLLVFADEVHCLEPGVCTGIPVGWDGRTLVYNNQGRDIELKQAFAERTQK